jgi:hypothetical protein
MSMMEALRALRLVVSEELSSEEFDGEEAVAELRLPPPRLAILLKTRATPPPSCLEEEEEEEGVTPPEEEVYCCALAMDAISETESSSPLLMPECMCTLEQPPLLMLKSSLCRQNWGSKN